MKTGHSSGRVTVMITDEEKGLIYAIATRVRRMYLGESNHSPFSHEDLVHYGIMGLCEAKQQFDTSRKIPFRFFAAKRVQGAMVDKLRRAPLVKIPQEQWQDVKELEKARSELNHLDSEPPVTTLAARLEWSVEKVNIVRQRVFSYGPANTTGSKDKDMGSAQPLPSKQPSPEDELARQEVTFLLKQCLQSLADAERLIVTCRFAIARQNQQSEEQTLQQLADTLDRTAENIRQRQNKALTQLKTCLEGYGLTNEDCHFGAF